MKAYGADLVLTPASGGMEEARDVVARMEREGRGRVLDGPCELDALESRLALTVTPRHWQVLDEVELKLILLPPAMSRAPEKRCGGIRRNTSPQ